MKFLAAFTTFVSAASLVAAAGSKGKHPKLYASANVASSTGTGITAKFEFFGSEDGSPTKVRITHLKGFKSNSKIFEGPFGYHIHTNPVGKALDCAKALAHLDPLEVTESLLCNPEFPEYCQTGDLSGKHGKFKPNRSGHLSPIQYEDDYLRFYPEPHSLLGRSVVVHAANKTRLACGNIISELDGTADKRGKPTYKPSSFVTDYPKVAPTNPPQVVTYEDDDEFLENMPFALANPALSLDDAQNVVLKTRKQKVWINGTETRVTLPYDKKTNKPGPF